MTPQTVNRLLQILVHGPMMLKHSKKLKNKYFKIALGAGGVVVILVAAHELLKDKERDRLQAAQAQQAAMQRLLTFKK